MYVYIIPGASVTPLLVKAPSHLRLDVGLGHGG